MTQPSSVRDNFTAQVILARSPDSYNIRAYFYEWFNLQSVSAYGEYQLNYTIYVNSVKGPDGDSFILWHEAPYWLSAQGQIPNIAQLPPDLPMPGEPYRSSQGGQPGSVSIHVVFQTGAVRPRIL